VKRQNPSDVTDLDVKDVDSTEAAQKPKRKHRQWGGVMLGLLTAVGGLALGRLGYLYPAFDVFAQFGMQFVMLAAGFVVAAFLPRYKAIFGFAIAAALVAGYGAWPHLVSNGLLKGPFPASEGEEIFTVAHFNIHAENNNLTAVANEIKRLDADVATLIEFEPDKQPVLDALATQYPHRYAFNTDFKFANLAIVSKFPILEKDGKGVWIGPTFGTARLGGRLEGLRVYAIHTTRFPYSRAQLKQMQALVRQLQPQRGGAMLMMGDFNTTPFSRLPGLIENGLNLRRVTHLPTWPALTGLPQLAIDHIFLGQNLRVVADQQIGNNVGSDHYPIVMTLAYKRP
jgi:endonuclease/exonuclease/phosphatase (EEP) superfamily protein YafD